jgi:hypothetical protein
MTPLSIALVLFLSGVSSMASAHGAGVDGQGGHNNRSAGNYHFHRGPLDGRTYDSKEDAAKALSVYSPGAANEAATDSSRYTERPLFDLAPGSLGPLSHHRRATTGQRQSNRRLPS